MANCENIQLKGKMSFLTKSIKQISNPKGKIKEVKVLRRRRQTTTEEQEFLDAHNEARFNVVPKAANMKKIVSQLQLQTAVCAIVTD